MPVVATIDGIKIEFYPAEHPPPHFHARYAEHVAQVGIRNVEVMRGALPPPQWRRVREWAQQRQGALMEAWFAIEEGRKPEKIRD